MRLLCAAAALALPFTAAAQPRDGGTSAPALSAASCDALVEHIVLVSIDETLANDPEVKKMTPREREVTERLARREALADPKLGELKKECPTRYDKKAEKCLLAAKSIKEIDACSK